jgi:hypothetical protein
MTTTINASTVSGLVNTADTSGILQLQTASTAALTIDASQNVGIGTASPAYKLNVVKPSAGVTARFTDGDGITDIYGYGLEITRSAAYIKSSGALQLGGTTGYNDLVINASGNVALQKNISVGGATPTTSGTGITFPATQSASSNANTLDDYEEGTWTPSLKLGGAAVGMTIAEQVGIYTKVGRVVYIGFYFRLTALGSSTGAATITGIPFTIASGATCSVQSSSWSNITANSIGGNLANGTSIDLNKNGTGMSNTDFANASAIYYMSGFYSI